MFAVCSQFVNSSMTHTSQLNLSRINVWSTREKRHRRNSLHREWARLTHRGINKLTIIYHNVSTVCSSQASLRVLHATVFVTHLWTRHLWRHVTYGYTYSCTHLFIYAHTHIHIRTYICTQAHSCRSMHLHALVVIHSSVRQTDSRVARQSIYRNSLSTYQDKESL